MSDIPIDVVKANARGKIRSNKHKIQENIKELYCAVDDLDQAIKTMDLEGIDDALHNVVKYATHCRSRMMYVRGVWSVYRDMRNTDGGMEGEMHE